MAQKESKPVTAGELDRDIADAMKTTLNDLETAKAPNAYRTLVRQGFRRLRSTTKNKIKERGFDG